MFTTECLSFYIRVILYSRFLVIDNGESADFASTRDGIPGLDTARGVTAECLLFSSTENHGTALSLVLAESSLASPAMPPGIKDAPQSLAIEPMGRKGEWIGRLQPTLTGELCQWIGGIDEVALYGCCLSADEIRAHAAALKP